MADQNRKNRMETPKKTPVSQQKNAKSQQKIANAKKSVAKNPQKPLPVQVKTFTVPLYASLPLAKKLNAKKILSLDIDVDKIRYVILLKAGNHIQVLNWGIQKFPTEVSHLSKALQIALENIKARYYKVGMEIRVTFFSTDLLFKNDVFPVIKNKKELEQAIFFRYKDEIRHFKDEEFYLSYYVVDQFEDQGIKKQRLQIVLSPKETINKYTYIFSYLKLPVQYLIPRPMSLVFAYNRMIDDSKSDLFINISYDFTQICYLKNGQLIYLRNLGIGSRNLEVTIKKEEKLKMEMPESNDKKEPDSDKESLLSKRLQEKLKDLKVKQNPVLHTFFSEILRSIAFIQGDNRSNYVERVLLTGYGIQKESLIPYLKSRLSMPIFVAFPGLAANTSDTSLRFGEFTAAVGAALANKDTINLIPKSFNEGIILNRLNRYLNLTLISSVVIFGYLTFLQYKTIVQKRNDLERMENIYETLNPFENSYKNLVKLIGDIQSESQKLQKKVSERPPILEMMRLISNLTPEDIHLEAFLFQPVQSGGKIKNKNAPKDLPKFTMSIVGNIKGDLVNGDVELINFINSLNNLNIFKEITVDEKNKDVENKKIDFGLTMTF